MYGFLVLGCLVAAIVLAILGFWNWAFFVLILWAGNRAAQKG